MEIKWRYHGTIWEYIEMFFWVVFRENHRINGLFLGKIFTGYHVFNTKYWLVVDLPPWKIWVRQLGWWHSQYMESHKIPWFQSPPTSYYLGIISNIATINHRIHLGYTNLAIICLLTPNMFFFQIVPIMQSSGTQLRSCFSIFCIRILEDFKRPTRPAVNVYSLRTGSHGP